MSSNGKAENTPDERLVLVPFSKKVIDTYNRVLGDALLFLNPSKQIPIDFSKFIAILEHQFDRNNSDLGCLYKVMTDDGLGEQINIERMRLGWLKSLVTPTLDADQKFQLEILRKYLEGLKIMGVYPSLGTSNSVEKKIGDILAGIGKIPSITIH